MPLTRVIFFKDEVGHAPVLAWLQELGAKQGHVQYRILYFFHGRNVAVLSHGLAKEDSIPAVEIERALKRKRQFEQNPEEHTYAAD